MNLPAAIRAGIIRAVRLFNAFGPDNDPHGEHDCATLTVGAERVTWKVDYYDRAMTRPAAYLGLAGVRCIAEGQGSFAPPICQAPR